MYAQTRMHPPCTIIISTLAIMSLIDQQTTVTSTRTEVRHRPWMFTINNPLPEDEPDVWAETPSRYVVWQHELGENQTPHIQGYLVLREARTLSSVKLLHQRAHWEPRRGTHRQAKEYCTKSETRTSGPTELGEEPQQGFRSDLARIKILLESGADLAEVAEVNFGIYLQYRRSLQAYRELKLPHRSSSVTVIVMFGPTGTGKSKFAHETFPNAYWKPPGKWWPDYQGQSTVIFDEFYGTWWTHSEMLRLLDRYPVSVEGKGTYVKLVATKFVITSNVPPHQWYTEQYLKHPHAWPALERRLTYVVEMLPGGSSRVHKDLEADPPIQYRSIGAMEMGINLYNPGPQFGVAV